MATQFKQDMPPRTGYGPIEWAKKIPRRGIGGYAMFGGFLTFSAGAWGLFYFSERYHRRTKLEMTDARIAIEPLILAEKHRMMMKQFRRNRDEENELMKDVPGWVTGKFYDEDLFHNTRGRFIWPSFYEYYSHNSWWDLYDRLYEKGKH